MGNLWQTEAKACADKGLYVVDPGAGVAGKYTESKKSYYARKYMDIHFSRLKPGRKLLVSRMLVVVDLHPLSLLRPAKGNH